MAPWPPGIPNVIEFFNFGAFFENTVPPFTELLEISEKLASWPCSRVVFTEEPAWKTEDMPTA